MQMIVFNDKQYNSVEEMPPNERQAYEHVVDLFMDKNGNGIPDFLEGDVAKNIMTAYTSASSFNVNGQVYNNMDEVPAEARQKIQSAFAKLSQHGIIKGSPIMMGASSMMAGTATSNMEAPSVPVTQFGPQSTSAIQEGSNSNLLLAIALGIAVLVCIVGAAGLYLYLAQ